MVRTVLLALSCCLLMSAPASAKPAPPPQCEDSAWLTPVDAPLNLPAPKCTGLSNQTALDVVPGSGPAHGEIHSGVYVPAKGFHGEDEVLYTVTDALNGQSNPFKIRLLVDTPPECRDTSATVTADRSLVLPEPDCSDKENDPFTLYYDDPANGRLALTGNRLVYTPNPGFTGQDSFPYYAQEDRWGVESDTEGRMLLDVVAPIKIAAPTPTPAATPVPTPAPDTTAPVVTLKNASKKQAVAVSLTRNENVVAKVTLTLDKATAKKLKLASRTVGTLDTALTPGTTTLAVKLSAKARKALKPVKKVKVTLTAVVTDASGNKTTKTLVLTLKK